MKHEQGAAVVLVVLIVALVVAIGFAIWALGESGEAKNCLKTLTGPITQYDQQWQASKAAGNPDVGICRQLNDLIGDYNRRCGAKYGRLPLENCG